MKTYFEQHAWWGIVLALVLTALWVWATNPLLRDRWAAWRRRVAVERDERRIIEYQREQLEKSLRANFQREARERVRTDRGHRPPVPPPAARIRIVPRNPEN